MIIEGNFLIICPITIYFCHSFYYLVYYAECMNKETLPIAAEIFNARKQEEIFPPVGVVFSRKEWEQEWTRRKRENRFENIRLAHGVWVNGVYRHNP